MSRCPFAALAIVPTLVWLSACQDPTQITLEVTTDVSCDEGLSTGVAVGELGAIESKPYAATSLSCDAATGRIGSLVAVPAGEGSAEVAFRIVSNVGGDLAACETPTAGDDCIVSRRVLGYLDNKKLLVPVVQRDACRGVPCDATTTCVRGDCVPAQIDPGLCTGAQGCGESTLGGGQGGQGGGSADPDNLVHDWTQIFGNTPGIELATALATDADGNVHLAAKLDSVGFDFGLGTSHDLAIVTYDRAGQIVGFYGNDTGSTTVNALVVDGAGKRYFVGGAKQDSDYGDGMPVGGSSDTDMLIGCLEANGSLDWVHAYGNDLASQANHEAWDVAVAADGKSYVVGYVSGSALTIGPFDVQANSLVLMAFAPDGGLLWLQAFSGAVSEAKVALDEAGQIYVAGTFSYLEIPALATPPPGDNAFVAKFNGTDGDIIWAKGFGGADEERSADIVVGPDGNVYVVGAMISGVDFGGGTVASAGINDTFVLALDGGGEHLWSRSVGLVEADQGKAIAVTPAGNLFVLGTSTINTRLISLTADGEDRFSVIFTGKAANPAPNSVAVGAVGDVFVAGGYFDALTIDGTNRAAVAGSLDGFLTRLVAP